jgi:hypothetical protein
MRALVFSARGKGTKGTREGNAGFVGAIGRLPNTQPFGEGFGSGNVGF